MKCDSKKASEIEKGIKEVKSGKRRVHLSGDMGRTSRCGRRLEINEFGSYMITDVTCKNCLKLVEYDNRTKV